MPVKYPRGMRSAPTSDTPWAALSAAAVGDLLNDSPVRWWLSGGVALDLWSGQPLRERENVDVSVTTSELVRLIAALPDGWSAWVADGDDGFVPFADADPAVDPHPVLVFDEARRSWALQLNVEDGSALAWMYKRDPRLQLPWERAVIDIDGLPVGAPEVQLVWKALRPRPEDDADKDAVLPALSDDARAWWERAILTIHPHSTWSIHVRSPFAPAKASWRRQAR